MSRLSQLYAELHLFQFYVDYLHDSLGNYYSKRQPHWTPQFRRRQIEEIRATIPSLYEDIAEIKKDIEVEKNRKNTYYNQDRYNNDNYEDEYEEYYEENDYEYNYRYTQQNDYEEDKYINYNNTNNYLEGE